MTEEREQRIRERAYRLWEEDGRPEGQADAYWQQAEQQVGAEASAAEPVRNPEPIPTAEDPMYPSVTGPEEVPPIEGAATGLNPEEIVEPKRASRPPRAAERAATGGTRRNGAADVKLRRRPGNTSPNA